MKVLFFVVGLGEYSQAQSVAYRLKQLCHEVIFVTQNKFLSELIQRDLFVCKKLTPEEIVHFFSGRQSSAEALILCNAHTTYPFLPTRPLFAKKIFSLDSNWLFNNELYSSFTPVKYLYPPWIDHIFVVFPHEIFEKNLIKNNGHYQIDDHAIRLIQTTGFVPSLSKDPARSTKVRADFGLSERTILVASYFSKSSFHTSSLKSETMNLYQSTIKCLLDLKVKMGVDIKIYDLSQTVSDSPEEEDIRIADRNICTTDGFNDVLYASDVVIMHYGYGTLAKVLSLQIPVLCQLPPNSNRIHNNYFELQPLLEKKAILVHRTDTNSPDLLYNSIEKLICNREYRDFQKKAQQSIFIAGESAILEYILS